MKGQTKHFFFFWEATNLKTLLCSEANQPLRSESQAPPAKLFTVFILLQSAGSIIRNTYFAAGTIGNLYNTAAGCIRMRVILV